MERLSARLAERYWGRALLGAALPPQLDPVAGSVGPDRPAQVIGRGDTPVTEGGDHVTRPQPGGIARDTGVLKTVHRERGGDLAVAATVVVPGAVAVGDALTVG